MIAPSENSIDVQKLWSKYEDMAMHFNGLLMILRSQALAGVAAISTLVGVYAKDLSSNIQTDWLVITAIFVALALFWIAIYLLDTLYYNRLLFGAVKAIHALEKQSKDSTVDGINMSTTISDVVLGKERSFVYLGVALFYIIVFLVIVSGAVFSWCMYGHFAPHA
jgi:hypothetical protein